MFWSLTGGQLTAWWQSQMQWGQASVVIEILSEQNLVCVIIVHRARNEKKSIPHDAFIVCSQTRTRPHSDQSYCTQALTKKQLKAFLNI